jgi:hypothetical protein
MTCTDTQEKQSNNGKGALFDNVRNLLPWVENCLICEANLEFKRLKAGGKSLAWQYQELEMPRPCPKAVRPNQAQLWRSFAVFAASPCGLPSSFTLDWLVAWLSA